MSVPTFEEIREALKIPNYKTDQYNRRIPIDNPGTPCWTEVYKFRQDHQARSKVKVRAGQRYD